MTAYGWVMSGFAALYVGREVVVLACRPSRRRRRPEPITWADELPGGLVGIIAPDGSSSAAWTRARP